MNIYLIAAGTRMPHWVQEGYMEYAKRLPKECGLKLVEIALRHRGKGADTRRIVRQEGERMLQAIPRGCRVVALEVNGSAWSTARLARELDRWMGEGRDVCLLVGGPEGLSDECLQRADESWSLSPLTLPHPLVRVVVAEQIYRAWSILRRRPYHRHGRA
jgi:23S rRNA (pseudouridine1915-N3)-methyltransferase